MALLVTLVLVVLLAVAAFGQRQTEIRRVQRRLAAVERKLDAVAEHLGVPTPEPRLPEVEDLIAQGRTIQAIKAYREATGADLVEAKEAVDRLSGKR
jgi:ribosomal protein L7/L12